VRGGDGKKEESKRRKEKEEAEGDLRT